VKEKFIPTEPAHLTLEHVQVGYNGKTILHDLTFTVHEGSMIAIIGPNGAGKSTLFKALVGLLPLQAGTALIHCQPIGAFQGCVAYVPQRAEFDAGFPVSVLDVVLMGRYSRMGWLDFPGKSDLEIAHSSLQEMGIADLAQRSLRDLSGGQLQRVFLARALAQQPHILLLDEPFNGVDMSTQETTLQLLEKMNDQGITIMVSTHDLNMAASKFEQVLLLNGRVIAFGSPQDVFTPHHLRQAFGEQMFLMNGAALIDECCPPAVEG